ncbi:hypothetical protein TNCV_4629191 [Trichonephila clavipes]|nr:hypothetical protein TNCV_4629191 [Trichonephila clavipes]
MRHYIRVFSDGPLNFEPWSSDEGNTRAGTPSPNFPTPSTRRRMKPDRFNVHPSSTRQVFSGTRARTRDTPATSDLNH